MKTDMPEMACPRCGAEHPDLDGFGFIAHTKPAYADGCGWCSHPSRDGDGKGNMVCTICGDATKATEPECVAVALDAEEIALEIEHAVWPQLPFEWNEKKHICGIIRAAVLGALGPKP